MNTLFNVYIDRLKDGDKAIISEVISSDFLDIDEAEELSFDETVKLYLEAYLAEDHLIIQFSVDAISYLPCNICNEKVKVPVRIHNEYYTQPLEEIKGHVYDTLPLVRETILLNAPPFTECNGGKCPERASMRPFLSSKEGSKDITYHPFADL